MTYIISNLDYTVRKILIFALDYFISKHGIKI